MTRLKTLALAAVFLTILGIAAPVGAAAAVRFSAVANYWTGGVGGSGWHAHSVAAADFTGDGRPDVVAADYFAFGPPFLLTNRGDGTFTSPGRSVPAPPAGPVGIVYTGDFNADGKPDLLLTTDLAVQIDLGRGNGTFTVSYDAVLPQGFQDDASIGDLNHDGKLDFVVKTAAGVQSYLGRGNGTFSVGPFSALPAPAVSTSSITLNDFNGDAYPDLAGANAISQQAFTLYGDGKGGFTAGASGYVGLGDGSTAVVPGSVVAGDFNHDGRTDLAAIDEFDTGTNSLAVLICDGHGGFLPAKHYDAGFADANAEIADLNGDGNLDIIGSDTLLNNQVVQLGHPDGTFSLGGKFPVDANPQTPVVADFNGDGRTDIAVVGDGLSGATPLSQLSVLLNES
ncbi:FG-GAP repeat domain-containing protein [Fodinicola feengrottensis]|uniref:VCBS repeat-containing protein n=1 Tax=Fodinicola feengrottensis TaxID=435914 RepID=A0ABP4UKB5_9ACTN|nr:VCBS repeat-containing protein [Fodinicola feengrottensis]